MANKVLQKGSKGNEVKVLQGLLNQKLSLAKLPNMRKLVEDGDFGRNTDSAVRTFQQLNHLKVDGIVGSKTWAALGVVAPIAPTPGSPAFVQLPQMSGFGYYSYTEAKHQFGTEKTIKAIKEVAATFRHNLPAVEIGIGHISLANGGNFPPHKSHRKGTDVDIRPLRKDGAKQAVTIHQTGDYSREHTQILVESLLSHANVKSILFNDSQISGVKSWPGHDNHLHVSMHG